MASLTAWSSAGVQSLLTVRHRPSRFQQVIEAVVDIFQQEPAILVDDDAGGLVAVFVVLQQEAMGPVGLRLSVSLSRMASQAAMICW